MKPIERSFTFLSGSTARKATLTEIRRSSGTFVNSYADVVERVAELSFQNPEYLLFFRGQAQDYRANGLTTLQTPIFRPKMLKNALPRHKDGSKSRDVVSSSTLSRNTIPVAEIDRRFKVLERAEEALTARYNLSGKERVQRFSILRWALLQHYVVCRTPLLDVTHSLRVACSFAFQGRQQGEPFLYVLGFPQLSGSVTTSSEHGLQIIRLLSVCPAAALRPHYQEGYLVGEFPTISFRQKMMYDWNEIDVANRLICKFRLANYEKFWQAGFVEIPHEALFPDARDALKTEMDQVEEVIRNFFEFEAEA